MPVHDEHRLALLAGHPGDVDALDALLAAQPAVLVYFSTPDCRVCQALRPKVAELLARDFPRLSGLYVDCAALPDADVRLTDLAGDDDHLVRTHGLRT